MRICVDISPAVHKRAGIGRYTTELMAALLENSDEENFTVFYNRSPEAHVDPVFAGLPRVTTALPDKLWRGSVLMSDLAGRFQDSIFSDIDLFHATDNLLPRLDRITSVFTLHDLSFLIHPQTHTLLNRIFLKIMMPRFLKAADAIIAVSEWTRSDAVRLYGIEDEKIRVIYPGVGLQFQPVRDMQKLATIRNTYALPDRFFLYVGSIEPRKNLPGLLEAMANLNQKEVKLVVVGKKGWRYQKVFQQVHTLKLHDQVLFSGYVPDNDLPAVYALAEALVYPSLYEGFGFPVLEAMACGTAVISSNASSLPEVIGEASILVDPKDIRGWVQALSEIINNFELQQELTQQGLRRAKGFNWQTTARETLKLYREAYEHRHRSAHSN